MLSILVDLNGDKALGPDGFPAALWQFNWDIVELDIMNLFKDFHESASFIESLSSTFLVLILKRVGAEDLKISNLLVWLVVYTSY